MIHVKQAGVTACRTAPGMPLDELAWRAMPRSHVDELLRRERLYARSILEEGIVV